MHVRLIQVDGKLPNLALMKLAHWHRQQGDVVDFTRSVEHQLFDAPADRVYASAIFTKSLPLILRLRASYPDAVIGGTGTEDFRTVEQLIGHPRYEQYDYSLYPEYPWSIGFTQRGCRLRCGFCVVPKKEGSPLSLNTIADIWRPGTPRAVDLLDNDFFGQPKPEWQARIAELKDGDFKVSFNQGVNIRLVNDEVAGALASVRYYDDQFASRRLYTAWDNLDHERVFFRGMEKLDKAGIPPRHLMVYMLTGWADGETLDEVGYRFQRLVDAGCKPYPMVYQPTEEEQAHLSAEDIEVGRQYRLKLRDFQRWVIRRYSEFVPFEDYDPSYNANNAVPDNQMPLAIEC